MGNCLKNPEDAHWIQWSNEFQSLQLRKSEIRKLYKIFQLVDKDHSGNIDLHELLDHLEMSRDNTVFRKRIFSIFDEDGSGQIDFREFVLATWNYCTLSKATLIVFAFDLYDKDNTGELNPMEIDRMLKDLYGAEYHSNQQAMKVSAILNRLAPEEELDVQKFEQFVHTHPILLFPAFQVQSALQNRILGSLFWERAAMRRIELSEGQFIPVGKFLELNLNSNLFDSKVAYNANVNSNAKAVLANSGTYFYRHSNAVNPYNARKKQWFLNDVGNTDVGSAKFNGQHKKDVHDVLRTKKQALTIEKVLADVRAEEAQSSTRKNSNNPGQINNISTIGNKSVTITESSIHTQSDLYASPFDATHKTPTSYDRKKAGGILPVTTSTKEMDQVVTFKNSSKPATSHTTIATNNSNNNSLQSIKTAMQQQQQQDGKTGNMTPLFGSTESLRSHKNNNSSHKYHVHLAAGHLETGNSIFQSNADNHTPVLKGVRRFTLDSIPSQRAVNQSIPIQVNNLLTQQNHPTAHNTAHNSHNNSRNNSRSNSRSNSPSVSRKEITPVQHFNSSTTYATSSKKHEYTHVPSESSVKGKNNSVHRTTDTTTTTITTDTTTTTTANTNATNTSGQSEKKSTRSRKNRRTF